MQVILENVIYVISQLCMAKVSMWEDEYSLKAGKSTNYLDVDDVLKYPDVQSNSMGCHNSAIPSLALDGSGLLSKFEF